MLGWRFWMLLLYFAYAHMLAVASSTVMSWIVAKDVIVKPIEFNFQRTSFIKTLQRGYPFRNGALKCVAYFRTGYILWILFWSTKISWRRTLYTSIQTFEVVVVVGGYMSQTPLSAFCPNWFLSVTLVMENKRYLKYSYALAIGAALFVKQRAHVLSVLEGLEACFSVIPY